MRSSPPLVFASAAAFSLLAAGCGGGTGSPGIATVASQTTTTTTTRSSHVAFTGCMRSNGVPSYPDDGKPTPQQAGVTESQFDAAVSACRRFLPHGGVSQETAGQRRTQRADGLSFAGCMRGHGVSRFPDPSAQGELTLEMVQAQGIDVHSPAVLRTVQTCLPASHGALTPAMVREAIDRAGR